MPASLYDILNDLSDENGLNRTMSVGELRKAMEYEATDPDDLEDEELVGLVSRLRSGYANVLVIVHDEDDRHISIVDRHKTEVHRITLNHMAQEGYRVVAAGVREYEYKDGNSYQHAFAEFRPQDKGYREVSNETSS